jgi:hypothetical protein
VIAWPTLNGKRIGVVLRATTWDAPLGIIADQTRSGKLKRRINHVATPGSFNVVMHMTLPEYRIFRAWWVNTNRKGFYSFAYPRLNDTTGDLVAYEFAPDTNPSIQNTSGDNLEISMHWMEAA